MSRFNWGNLLLVGAGVCLVAALALLFNVVSTLNAHKPAKPDPCNGDCVEWLLDKSPTRYCEWVATIATEGGAHYTAGKSRAELDSWLTVQDRFGRPYTDNERQVIITWLRRGWDQAKDGFDATHIYELNKAYCWTGGSDA